MERSERGSIQAGSSPSPVFLSIVIPAYNEAHRLPVTLRKILTFLDSQPYTSEVVVVENGSQDETYQIAMEHANRHTRVHVHQNNKRGKGLAVQKGMLESRGEFRFMCDADLSMPIDELNRFLPPKLTDFDIAIASREAPGAIRYNEPRYRHFVGRAFNIMIRQLALPDLQDTQCGFKCFRGEIVPDLFRRQTIPGWSFDVEILYIARLRGYRILEIPIPWYYNADSKVRVFSDSIQMGSDLLAIRRKAAQGAYDGQV
ncbi:MAG: glycosyltransferase family 2 protein [Anaerolineales bacterium]|nr:glycosyltransferase family 2 protein [Anaerolineales bacterium]